MRTSRRNLADQIIDLLVGKVRDADLAAVEADHRLVLPGGFQMPELLLDRLGGTVAGKVVDGNVARASLAQMLPEAFDDALAGRLPVEQLLHPKLLGGHVALQEGFESDYVLDAAVELVHAALIVVDAHKQGIDGLCHQGSLSWLG